LILTSISTQRTNQPRPDPRLALFAVVRIGLVPAADQLYFFAAPVGAHQGEILICAKRVSSNLDT
jgi:hypothetical protein